MRLEKVLQPLHSETYNKQHTSAANGEIEKATQKQEIKLYDERAINKEDIEKITSELNEFIEPLRTNLKFKYHELLQEYYVTVVDQKTKEVIKEIPSKDMLDMYAAMAEFMGLLVDETV